MNIESIKKARMILGEIISDNIDLVGKSDRNMLLLCQATGLLVQLLNRLSNPEKYEKIDKIQKSMFGEK
jgi:hypothetical protein